MIEISLHDLVAWALAISLGAVVVFAWVSHTQHAKREKKARNRRAVCRLCLAVFEVDGRFEDHRCPHCHGSTGHDGPTPLG